MVQLKKKSVLVTGGSRVLGRAIVEALAAEGANVWAIARDARQLDLLKQEMKGVQTRVADVALPQTDSETLREIGPDILVLNAGATSIPKPVHELTWEQFSLIWETDVKATFQLPMQ
jgi:NAD(P)-dependent dehydrogenase (short-subunit alcohol dehydrogenase family)